MASISVPCPKCTVAPQTAPLARPGAALLAGSARPPFLKVPSRSQFPILKAQIKEIAIESSNSSVVPSTKSGTLDSNGKCPDVVEESTGGATVSDITIAAFMSEVSDLVKLVDSRDITELQLKQKDCELIIRKKSALQPAPAAPVSMMQPPAHAAYPSPGPSPQTAPSPTPAASTPAPALPPPKGSKSSVPPLKCPMAGTFYRCSGPGEPPFVKVGDKVKKGQVVCIIEAMKLMNEIEADQSGTVVEVLVEDGKPVSVDMPLFTIEP